MRTILMGFILNLSLIIWVVTASPTYAGDITGQVVISTAYASPDGYQARAGKPSIAVEATARLGQTPCYANIWVATMTEDLGTLEVLPSVACFVPTSAGWIWSAGVGGYWQPDVQSGPLFAIYQLGVETPPVWSGGEGHTIKAHAKISHYHVQISGLPSPTAFEVGATWSKDNWSLSAYSVHFDEPLLGRLGDGWRHHVVGSYALTERSSLALGVYDLSGDPQAALRLKYSF